MRIPIWDPADEDKKIFFLFSLGLVADPAKPAKAEAGCLSGLASLSIEIQKYKKFFQIICSIIIPAYKP